MNLNQLTKYFILANKNVLSEHREFLKIQTSRGVVRVTFKYPKYLTISEGKAMQKMDMLNFTNDFKKSINLAKLKLENDKASTTQ